MNYFVPNFIKILLQMKNFTFFSWRGGGGKKDPHIYKFYSQLLLVHI